MFSSEIKVGGSFGAQYPEPPTSHGGLLNPSSENEEHGTGAANLPRHGRAPKPKGPARGASRRETAKRLTVSLEELQRFTVGRISSAAPESVMLFGMADREEIHPQTEAARSLVFTLPQRMYWRLSRWNTSEYFYLDSNCSSGHASKKLREAIESFPLFNNLHLLSFMDHASPTLSAL